MDLDLWDCFGRKKSVLYPRKYGTSSGTVSNDIVQSAVKPALKANSIKQHPVCIGQNLISHFSSIFVISKYLPSASSFSPFLVVVVIVVLLFYVHGEHLRSCRDGQLTKHTFTGQA